MKTMFDPMLFVCTTIATVAMVAPPSLADDQTWLSCDGRTKSVAIGSLKGTVPDFDQHDKRVYVVDLKSSVIMGYGSGDKTLDSPTKIEIAEHEISWRAEYKSSDAVRVEDFTIDRRTLEFFGKGEMNLSSEPNGKILLTDFGKCAVISPLPLEENKF